MKKLWRSLKLLKGSWTPFLIPFWNKWEQTLISEWLKGAHFPKASQNLQEIIVSRLGDGWHACLLNYGRSAIQLALESMKCSSQSEVIIPSFSCASLLMSVIQSGLKPVLVDVDTHFNIRYESVLEAFTPRVKAVILPHLSGCWVRDTEKIISWAKQHGIFVIEDCAQSFGLKYKGKFAGTFGDVGIFSSGFGKTVFGPGGGWLITKDPMIISYCESKKILPEPREKATKRIEKFLKRYPFSKKEQGRNMLYASINARLKKTLSIRKHDELSLDNYRFPVYKISNIEAQLAQLQIQKIDIIIDKHREFAARWQNHLSYGGLKTIQFLPVEDNIYTKMLLSFTGKGSEEESNILRKVLWINAIEGEESYTPLHLRTPFQLFRHTSMKVTEHQWKGAFCVPVRPNLDDEDWKRIDKTLSDFKKHYC